ncbi:MAG: 3-deoxy-8-phosphooctulonate synthase [Bacteroidetes bacterium]|nr:MAG: 3-deoxy-8-phosphooctulonate synthase [Bacteroidota bacterium]
MTPNPLYDQLRQGPFFIAGPCVIESQELLDEVAAELSRLRTLLNVPIVFKSSFDKANRTSGAAFRGPGVTKGLEMLAAVKSRFDLPLTTDIHESWQAPVVAEVVDILQIPAFLCRQTDLLLAAAHTGNIVNVKKAQFLSGADMHYPAEKIAETGNTQLLLTERGNMFGYNNLVVDFRNIPDMKALGYPVVMDCTHSVQRPGGAAGKTGGNREYVPLMAYAAQAFGANGYFLEVHPDPDTAPSDGPNMLYIKDLEGVMRNLLCAKSST